MNGHQAVSYARDNVAELDAVVDSLDPEELNALIAALTTAPRVFFTGIGRSGLSARAVAMRLMHIGLTTYVAGEIATPGIGADDLLVAISSSGRGSIAAQGRSARAHGARVATITTKTDGELQSISSTVLVLPIRDTVTTAQHAGSLFEQSALVIGDAICRVVQEQLQVPTDELNRRHANLS